MPDPTVETTYWTKQEFLNLINLNNDRKVFEWSQFYLLSWVNFIQEKLSKLEW